MADKEIIATNVKFPSGEIQTEAPDVRYLAFVSAGFSGSVDLTVIAANFTPALPAGVTVVPLILVRIVQCNSIAPGGGASVMGFNNAPGSPFNGVVLGNGAYKDVAINDKINLSGSANNAAGGSGSGNWVIEAYLKK